ncbi:cation transporter [Kitasatospora sp. GP82]|uniref:heavy-metal-associated domain-containing protein n=1 Tax=Kitasatospora sp. GP82 TaxID=3035089 RepID=UPI0024758CBB|nr:cation transporter [Kitasatospora sp. GP82]MDH6129545.1 copper ion binding protein [Kitasatospora sp. GP82]
MSENLLTDDVTKAAASSCCGGGSCGTGAAADAPSAATGVRETYLVQGMTCGHCVSSVTAELKKLAGVSAVAVDLASGNVTVDSDQPLERSDVAEAIDEAGYELVEHARA